MIIAAYNEETVIARRIENLLELDYPQEKLEIVVTSDASTDRTEEIALAVPRRPGDLEPARRQGRRPGPRGARDRREIVAFSDANCTWSPDALRKLVRAFADPEVAYVCGQLRILAADGSNKEGVYWRYEMGVRAAESSARLGHGRQRLDLRRCAATTTSRSILASATTSRCRT